MGDVSLTLRRPLAGCVLVAALVVVAGCGVTDGGTRPTAPSATPATTATAAAQARAVRPIAPLCASPLDSLTQRERIAQLFTVGVSSVADARRAVAEHTIGGIFLGGDVVREVVSGDGLTALLRDSPLPLLVAIDEEGGRVSRVAPFAGPLPSARVMATTMHPEEVRGAARTRGEFLRGMGVSVDFAPSVDVSEQADGAVIGDRSFSPDPALVVHYAGAFAAGLLDAGVAPVFKHFPGHGRSSGDSHHQPVTVPPLDQLVDHDLRPFAELAQTPGAAMMMGHPQVPGLTDVGRPASLSPAAYRLLRGGHGYGAAPFDGVIFTDDLSGMRAVTNDFPLPQAVAESLIAGADSPLWTTTAGIPAALDAVEQALAEGVLDRRDLDRSLARVAALRGIPDCLDASTTDEPPGGAVDDALHDAASLAVLAPGLPPHPDLPTLRE